MADYINGEMIRTEDGRYAVVVEDNGDGTLTVRTPWEACVWTLHTGAISGRESGDGEA